jgi:protein gp37
VSDSSNIEWTDATWNPVVGCSRVSAGCDHCYAVGMTRRLEGMSKAGGFGLTGHRAENYRGLTIELPQAAVDRGCGVNGRHFNGEVRCVEEALEVPMRWKKPKRIFVNSMSDLFHPKVPFEFIDKVFAVMALCPQHTFQVLTKRPERMAEYMTRRDVVYYGFSRKHGASTFEKTPCDRIYMIARSNPLCRRELLWPLPNVWLGTSCEDQAAADERIPHLLSCPAAVRFLSCEPLLGPIHIHEHWLRYSYSTARMAVVEHDRRVAEGKPPRRPAIGSVDWVIVGGESGPSARACNVAWLRAAVGQCRAAGVPCFVKQLGSRAIEGGDFAEKTGPVCGVDLKDRKGGEPSEWPEDLRVRQMPAGGVA